MRKFWILVISLLFFFHTLETIEQKATNMLTEQPELEKKQNAIQRQMAKFPVTSLMPEFHLVCFSVNRYKSISMKISYWTPFTITHTMRFSNAAFEMQASYCNKNQAPYAQLLGHMCRSEFASHVQRDIFIRM